MADPNRAERLKAALRENLKRRKAQARARADSPSAQVEPISEPPPPAAQPPPSPDDGT